MQKKEVTPEPDYKRNKVVVHNNYIRAIHPEKIGISGMKLFRYIISLCRMDDVEFFEYGFTITQLAEILGTSRTDIHRDIRDISKSLMQTILFVGSDDPRADWEYKHIFNRFRYSAKDENITIQLHQDMKPLFLQLKKNFTSIPLETILLLRSKYSIRIYELLNQKMMSQKPYADTAILIRVSVDEIRQVTNTADVKTYNVFTNFRKRIFEPSMLDIERASNWKIIYTEIKRGRRIVAFDLEIWSRQGYDYLEQCKQTGKLPTSEKDFGI